MPANDELAVQTTHVTRGQEGEGTNLTKLILEKIAAHETATVTEPKIQGGGPPKDAIELPVKVVEVYTKLGAPGTLSLVESADATLQDRTSALPLQIRNATQAVQGTPNITSMGRASFHH